jgi:hypothetical protein
MHRRKISIFLGGAILLLALLACRLNLGGPAAPSPRIPVSTEAVTQVQSALDTAAAEAAQTGKATIQLTEAQVTSYLAAQLAQQSEPMFSDPQVLLRDQEVQVYGVVDQSVITAKIKIVLTMGVDPEGYPKIDLASANFGPLPVPQGLRETITNSIRQAYLSALGQAASSFHLDGISVENGSITASGHIK